VTVLVVGMAVVVFSVAGLAIDGTRAFLERRALQNLADGAALAAADRLDTRAFYEGGGEVVRLEAGSARLVAIEWLERSSRPVRAKVAIDGPTIEVSVRGEVRTQFLRLVGVDVIGVEAVSRARPEAGSVP
jgi:Flp pilus assembly protein TadG